MPNRKMGFYGLNEFPGFVKVSYGILVVPDGTIYIPLQTVDASAVLIMLVYFCSVCSSNLTF